MRFALFAFVLSAFVSMAWTPVGAGAHPLGFVHPVGSGRAPSVSPAWNGPDSRVKEFDAPGATTTVSTICGSYCGTIAYSINDWGVSVGFYTDKYVVPHAFARMPDGHVLAFDAPGAGLGHGLNEGTAAYAINDRGAIAGQYEDAKLVYHGFIRSPAGVFTTFEAAGAGTGANQGTLAWNIDAVGTTSGVYIDASNVYHGFLRSAGGKTTSFDPAGSIFTYVCEETCLNAAGTSAGFFADSAGVYHGFVREANGKITTIDVPGAARVQYYGTFAASITADGTIAGYYFDSALIGHGFIRYPSGRLQTFNAPRSNTAGTYPFSINIFRAIAGQTADDRGFEHFSNGTTIEFAAPDAVEKSGNYGTRPSVNNAFGVVAGWYFDTAGLNHGFVWTP